MATSPAAPKTLSAELFHSSPASVGVSSVPRMSSVVAVPEEFLLFNAAITSQTQPEAGPSFTGDLAGGLFPAIPLTSCPEAASRHGDELDTVADLSREGPFDIHQDHTCSVASPQLMQDTQGCLFRMASYDVEAGGPNFAPAYGVQLYDQRLLEYVGAPESATSRSNNS